MKKLGLFWYKYALSLHKFKLIHLPIGPAINQLSWPEFNTVLPKDNMTVGCYFMLKVTDCWSLGAHHSDCAVG